MTRRSSVKLFLYSILLVTLSVGLIVPQISATGVVYYGDTNIEQWTSTIGGNMVQAYMMFTISGPVVIRSVSMYTQYSGSDGTQCMYFGIYQDNGHGSPAGQRLVASTSNSYCLRGSVTWGPAWETWKLLPSDYLTINGTGSYWLAVLASQTYGYIYHYAYSSSYDYTYGYATYFFTTPYSLGFPTTFASTWTGWEGNGPYSIFVTGVA